jgi:transposase
MDLALVDASAVAAAVEDALAGAAPGAASAAPTTDTLRRGWRLRIYPTPAQVATLRRWEGNLRWLWNLWCDEWHAKLEGIEHIDRETGEVTTVRFVLPDQFSLQFSLTSLRKHHPSAAELPRQMQQAVLLAFVRAAERFLRGVGPAGKPARPPRRKRHAWACPVDAAVPDAAHRTRAGDHVPLQMPRPTRVELDPDAPWSGPARVPRSRRGAVHWPKLGPIACVVDNALPGTVRAVTLVEEADGWYAVVSCAAEVPKPTPATGPVLGLDRGVVNLLADSAGRLTPHPRWGRAAEDTIVRLQRKAAGQVRGSQGWHRTVQRIARLSLRVRRQRDGVLHAESLRIAGEVAAGRWGAVALEALDVVNMTASAAGGSRVAQKAGLNRAILDGAWGRMEQLLTYKVEAAGGAVLRVPSAYSSQTCAACGVVDAASRRSQAEFACVACGHTEHADTNAARVIAQRGELQRGGGADRRPVKKLRTVRRKAATGG